MEKYVVKSSRTAAVWSKIFEHDLFKKETKLTVD